MNQQLAIRRDKTSRKFLWWHDVIIDWMFANPGASYIECAKFFRKSPTTISMIVNSDMFKMQLATRRQKQREALQEELVDQTTKFAKKAIDVLHEKLEDRSNSIPFRDVADAADRALARLGFNPPNTGAVVVNNDNRAVSVTPDVLRSAQERLRANEARRSPEPKVEAPSPVSPPLDLLELSLDKPG